jgi:hypothetical protein
MGAIAVVTFVADGINIDSFALPYIWVSMGLVTAASMLTRQQTQEENTKRGENHV